MNRQTKHALMMLIPPGVYANLGVAPQMEV
jgi:hypothetical protein